MKTTVTLSMLGALAVIIAVLSGCAPLDVAGAAGASTNSTPTLTASPVPPPTETPTPLPPPTSEGTRAPVASLLPPTLVMRVFVVLEANRFSGVTPFFINFNAERSTFQLADGTIVACQLTKNCQFSWDISREGTLLESQLQAPDGHLQYTFIHRGPHVVTVTVCREQICGTDRVEIESK